MKNYSKELVLEAISKSSGVTSYVAAMLGCNFVTAQKYIAKWPETKEAFSCAGERLNALAYKSFMRAIDDGERWAVERVLDTSARRNGHALEQVQKVDHTTGGKPIKTVIEIIRPPPVDAELD